MGEIDNLNFAVLLDDSKFKATIEDDKRLARELNTDLSKILDLKMGGSNAFEQIKSLLSDIKTNTGAVAGKINDISEGIDSVATSANDAAQSVGNIEKSVDGVADSEKKVEEGAKRTNDQFRTQSGILRELGSLAGAYFSVRGVEKFLSSLIRVTGEFEVQKMALTSMLGSAETADQIFSTLRQSALESPYTFQELTKYAKQLTAFNIDADKLVETEKMLADVSAGLGVDMGRIILAYGQVKAAGVLKGTELRQFTEAGVPLLQSLADQLSRTEGKAIALSEVFSRISKKEIPFEMVEQAFRDMTSEGGKFYNMQEVLVQTLQGKIGKLRDVWQQALYDIGNSNSTVLKGAVDIVTALASHIDFIVKLLAPLVAGIGAYATVAAIAWSASKLATIGEFVKYIGLLTKGVQAATAAQTAFASSSALATGALATTAGAIGAVVAILAALGVGIYEVSRNMESSKARRRFNEENAEIAKTLEKEKEKLDDLFEALKEAKRGTDEYAGAKKNIVDNYGKYFEGLDKEIEKVGGVEQAYKDLTAQIEESIKMRQFADIEAKERGARDEAIEGAKDQLRERLLKNLPALEVGELMREWTENYFNKGIDTFTAEQVNNTPYFGWLQKAAKKIAAARNAYLRNMSAFAAEYGMENTIWNPDFVGPTLPPTKVEPKKAPGSEGKPWSPDGWKDDNSATRAIENQINLLRTFKNAYDDLAKAGMSGGEAEQFLLNIFPDFADIIKTADFDKAITAELEKLKTLDPEAYKSLALSLGNEGLAKALKELAEAGKENKAVEPLSQSQIDKLAAIVFKDKTSHLSMKGYKNKSVFSIADIIKELKDLELTAKDLDADTLEKIKNGQLTLEDLQKTFEKMRKEKTAEAAGALAQHFKILAKGIADLADSLVAYGEAGGNEFAKGLGEAINEISGLASSVAQGFSQGGWVGGIVAGVVYIGKVLLEDLTYMEELQNRISSAQVQKWAKDMNSILGSGDGFFGENGLQKIRSSAEVATKALEKLQTATAKINAGTNIKTADKSWISNAFGWLVQARTGNKAVASLFADQVRTLGDVASQLGYELYNENGIINSEALQAILDTYDKLGSKDRQWMEEAIVYAEEYKTALEALDEVTQSIFGDLASSAADAIVESWATAGDAALDYADILDDVAKRYAKMLVQSTLIDSVLTPDFKNELNALVGSGDVEGAMALVADGMARIQAQAPMIQEILSPLVPYLNGNESSAESSLGNGIKSITEDTANLLAAYINGIRADVAAGNSQRAEILALVREYVGAGSAPSYTEYLTHIEAHTQNIAANTNAILSQLRSIITPESGLPAVRVQTA